LDQLKFEIEDGYTPEGAQVRYGYDDRLFPDFSWRGYAILIPYQVRPSYVQTSVIKSMHNRNHLAKLLYK